jgi:hypothetical protein
MTISPVTLTSLDPAIEKILVHLNGRHDTALIAAPGCGATTLSKRVKELLDESGVQTFEFDVRSGKDIAASIKQLAGLPNRLEDDAQRVLILDHAAKLLPEDFRAWLGIVQREAPRIGATCFWIGSLDARNILGEIGVRINTVPKSHVSFPLLPRDEMLAAYRSIAEANECRWGEAILFLLLDFCGNDLSLVRSATDYLHGDWSDKLYDVSVWDRIGDWLANDEVIDMYRRRMDQLSEPCKKYLDLIRIGGKPPCLRTELLEEVNDALRNLCLLGFLSQNLLPRYYQLRNLTIRYLVHEPFEPWNGCGPKILFRRATNERAGQLLQDMETMLRAVLLSLFHLLGPDAVRALLEGKQSDNEFLSSELNRSLLEWANNAGGQDLKQGLNALLVEHRKAFKTTNSVWARVTIMMEKDGVEEDGHSLPHHLRCINYLTFGELGDVLVDQLDRVFPGAAVDDGVRGRLKERWRENISKVRRLRNRVAHLRNIDFQDMEDLVGTVESMRRDLLDYTGWR